jgi:hypothetical protein
VNAVAFTLSKGAYVAGPFVSGFGYAEPLLRVVRYLTMTKALPVRRFDSRATASQRYRSTWFDGALC